MSFSHKNLFILLIVFISVAGIILFRQILVAKNIVTTPVKEFVVSPNVLPIPLDHTEPTLGNPGAPLTIIEFSDLGCSKCHETHKLLTSFVSANPTKAKLIWKDLPNQAIFSRDHRLVHQAAWCAHNQKQFWKFIEKVINTKNYNKESTLKNIAQELKLDTDVWWECTKDLNTQQKMDAAIVNAHQLGIRRVPALFINNKQVNLSEDLDLENLLNSLLEQ